MSKPTLVEMNKVNREVNLRLAQEAELAQAEALIAKVKPAPKKKAAPKAVAE